MTPILKSCTELLAQLKQERRDFDDWAEAIATSIDPRRGEFYDNDSKERGVRKDRHILNNTVLKARRICVAGMYAGASSPSNPWFKLESLNMQLMQVAAVRNWVYNFERTIRGVLSESNFYTTVKTFLAELTTFSTGVIIRDESFDNVVRFSAPTFGTYWLGYDDEGDLSTFVIKRTKFARQLREEFGENNLPDEIKIALKNGQTETRYKLLQCIQKNPDYKEGALENTRKKYRSVKWLEGYESHGELSDSGFDRMPVYAVRWETVGEEAYGTGGPGMVALGDNNALQAQEREKAKAVARSVSPLLKGPPEFKNLQTKNLTSGIVAYDDTGSREGLTPIFQVDPRINELRMDMQDIERRINEAFFVDLFQAISSMQGVQPRNQLELSQRNQESLTLLGPVIEGYQRDFLSPVIKDIAAILVENDMVPPPPAELEGAALDIRFIGSLSLAQRSMDVRNLESYVQFGQFLAAGDPTALKKVNTTAAMDLYAQLTGTIPDVVVDNEVVQGQVQAEQQMMQQQMMQDAEAKQASANVQNATAAKAASEIE